jgi:3-methyl-2-oxobutanoate hydroxymethyltransferase
VNAAELQAKKARGEPLVVLTCSDYPSARWQEAAGVDIVFCADSLGTNLLGYEDEREVTMEDMIHHLKAVRRGLTVGGSYLLADLPYGSCDTSEEALDNSLRFRALGADGVKFEGFKPETVRVLRERGIDVCCHLGLNPQIHREKKLQARSATDAIRLLQQCIELQDAGGDSTTGRPHYQSTLDDSNHRHCSRPTHRWSGSRCHGRSWRARSRSASRKAFCGGGPAVSGRGSTVRRRGTGTPFS